MMRCVLLSWILAFLLIPTSFAGNSEEGNEIPEILNFDHRASYLYRFEFSPYGGEYFGDKLGSTFITGGNIQFNLTEVLGVATDFGYSRVSVDRTSALGLTFSDLNEYIWDIGFVITRPAAFRGRKGAVEADLFSSIGGGLLWINGSSRAGAYVGGGMKIRPKIKWLAIRVEVRNYFTSINNPAGSDFEDDLTFRVGPTFFFPPEL